MRGADKWYIGGRTATGEEKFFKLGVVRRVRSGDRLSAPRMTAAISDALCRLAHAFTSVVQHLRLSQGI